MNINQITWKDAFGHKYVILCLICGGLLLVLGITFIAIYLILSSYTSSLHYFETIPTYVPAISLIVNGIIVSLLAKRHLRYFYLIKISGAFCLISALICVVTTVTTTVIHLNRLQTLQGCEYTASSSTCICMTGSSITGSNDPSVQVTGHSSHYAFQNISNCDVVHGSLNTCLRALFGVSVFGILISIFTSMLVYQLMSHEKKKKYLEQLESRRRFHQHAFSRRDHDTLGPPPFPLLSYPPPHALAAQGCSAFMDDIFYPNGAPGGRGGWIWPPPPPPPWDLIDYRSYCTPSYDSPSNPGPCTNSSGEPGSLAPGEITSTHRTSLLNVTGRGNDCSTTSPESNSRTIFGWLFSRHRRQRRNVQRSPTSRRLLSRDRIHGQSVNSAECTGALVTENRHNHRSPNYAPLPPPHSSPPPPPLSPTLPPPHHPLLPVGHFSPLLIPLHPSYRSAASAMRSRSLARLNTRRTRSNDAIFHHLHNMAYAHPPPPPFFNGPSMLNSPQSLFAAWGPPPPYSQPSSMENVATDQTNDSNRNVTNSGNFGNNNSNHSHPDGNGHHRPTGNHGSNRRRNQINSATNGSDGYDNSSSKLSTPVSERRMLCNAFSSDGITLTIGGPVVTTSPSKSSCIVEVHVQDDHHIRHPHGIPSESKISAFSTLPNKRNDDDLSSYNQHNHPNHHHHNSYKSLSNIPVNNNNKQFTSNQQELAKSIDTIIYDQQNQSNEHNFNCVIDENYLDDNDTILANVDLKSSTITKSVIYDSRPPLSVNRLQSTGLKSNIIHVTETTTDPEMITPLTKTQLPSSTISIGSSTSTSTSLTKSSSSSSSSSSGSHNLYSLSASSASLLDVSQSTSQPINANLLENLDLGYSNITDDANKAINLKINGNLDVHLNGSIPLSVGVGYGGHNKTDNTVYTARSNSIVADYMVTVNDDHLDYLPNEPGPSADNQMATSTSSTITTPNNNNNGSSTFHSNTKHSSNTNNNGNSNNHANNINTKETNCPETGSQGKVIGSNNETETHQAAQYMQTQSMPNLSYAAAVSITKAATRAAATTTLTAQTITASPSHQASSASSSSQVTPQHGSKNGYQHPSSGNTSTSQDIADLELELDEEPLCYLPDLPYDGSQTNNNIMKESDQSEQSSTPQYQDMSVTKVKPPTPFANCPSSSESSTETSSTSSASQTISDNINKEPTNEMKNHQQLSSTAVVGDNIIVTIRSIQV